VKNDDLVEIEPSVVANRNTGAWVRAGDSDVQKSKAWQEIRNSPVIVDSEELYDLLEDPNELYNLAHCNNYRSVLRQHKNMIDKMIDKTDSPILDNHIPPNLSRTNNKKITA